MADAKFSTLELAQPGLELFRAGSHALVEQGKQVVIADVGKHVVSYSDHDGGGMESMDVHSLPIDQHYQESPIFQKKDSRRKRRWILFGGAIVLIVGAIVGGVLGGLKPRHPPRNSIPAATTSNSTSSSNITASQRYHIAAATFELGSMNNTRVFHQDNGSIYEVSSPATGTTWTSASIAASTDISLDSNLAAAVSRPGYPLVSTFFTVRGFV